MDNYRVQVEKADVEGQTIMDVMICEGESAADAAVRAADAFGEGWVATATEIVPTMYPRGR